eukprot:15366770-Ditylum_brightwellii.AAC.1
MKKWKGWMVSECPGADISADENERETTKLVSGCSIGPVLHDAMVAQVPSMIQYRGMMASVMGKIQKY